MLYKVLIKLYVPEIDEAYEMFKRYNFKTFLKRFDMSSGAKEPDIYQHFRTVSDFPLAEEEFTKLAASGNIIGLSLLYENNCVTGAAFASGDEDIAYIDSINADTEK